MSKVIYSGLESSGKSLKLAMIAIELVYRNAKWRKISGRERPIYSNMQFTPSFKAWAEALGVPLRYWLNTDDLIDLSDCDILCDEVGNYFDSRLWADLSLDVRRWLTQGAKQGIEFYGAAQDFAQVDKSFRRLCNELYLIRKLIGSRRPSATKPPVKRIWGVCMMSQLDPQGYKEDEKKFVGASIIPSFFLIERKYCEIFDTNQKIERSLPSRMKHIERWCEDDKCSKPGHHKIMHV